METSPAVSERQSDGANSSIYGARDAPASEPRGSDGRFIRSLTGFVLGAATWMLLSRLGFPHIFGLPASGGELPFGIAGSLLGHTRFRKWIAVIPASLVALLAIVSLTDVISGPARSLIRRDPIPPNADAVVVLSAGVTGDGFMPQQGTDRLRKALELIQAKAAPTLVVSRERRFIDGKPVSSITDQDKMLAMAGVSAFIATGWARSTRDEAVYVAKVARERRWTRIILVTSPFHSRRACATFERAGVQVSCVPADSRDIAVQSLRDPDDRIAAFAMLIYEVAGTIRYQQQDWL